MNKIMFLIVISLMMLACTQSTPGDCLKTVQSKYPNSQVVNIPTGGDNDNSNCNYKFIVKDDSGSVHYIETLEGHNNISLDKVIVR